MKITWGEIKRNIRCVNHESPGAYEHEHQITSNYEFEFDVNPEDIACYMLSNGKIKAVSRYYTMSELVSMGVASWNGPPISEINWKESNPFSSNDKCGLMTIEEYAATLPDEETKETNYDLT